MFDAMMRHFGPAVQAIRGNWIYGDNLATVNQLTAGGTVLLEEAAHRTRTGGYARTWGCTVVELLPQSTGVPGAYQRVYVLFKK